MIKRFFECLLPITACNIKCSYCYVIQRDNRLMKQAELKYTPEQIGNALTKKRLGGVCYFSICGAGETTIQKELPEIVFNILKNGHFVNITTNGTLSEQIKRILDVNKENAKSLHFAFSFHYLELLRLKKIDVFFENVNLVKKYGASFMVQINLCDEYIPYLDEIKQLCKERIGAFPQVAATRKEVTGLRQVELLTNLTSEEYSNFGKTFDSPLFDFTMHNFNKKQKGFCYAGEWSGTLNLATGVLKRCYCSYYGRQDIFKNPQKKIKFLAIGNNCGSPFCMNSSHFMSLGIIPEQKTPSYESLRNREIAGWYNDYFKSALSGKLIDDNKEYNVFKKIWSNIIGFFDHLFLKLIIILRKIIK